MLTSANHLGRCAEELAAVDRQVGNVPRAFTRLALIDAAVRRDHRLDHPRSSTILRTGTAGDG